MPTISLCTYTYNDKNLLFDLLRSIKSWTIVPDEIIIVDDCSDCGPAIDDLPFRCSIVRLNSHTGLRHVKQLGPTLAKSEYILSIDCDTRITPDWLERCLPHAAKKDIGIVSGPLVQRSGDDTVSRYLKYFGDNHNVNANGLVDFIPGNARLIRAEVWKNIGGLTGHDMEICEDRYLCAKMKAFGYGMYVDKNATVFQTRKLSRAAMVRRFYNWNFMAYKMFLTNERDFLGHVYFDLVLPFLEFYSYAVELNEPAFVYLEFLNLVFTVSNLVRYAVTNLGFSEEIEHSWKHAIACYLSRYPSLRSLLFEDAFGQNPLDADTLISLRDDTSWDRIFSLLDPFTNSSGVWDWMERKGVRMIRQEDLTVQHDFSFHLQYKLG